MDWVVLIHWAFATAVLVFIGGLIWWRRSRKRGEGTIRRRVRRTLLTVSGAVIALYLGYCAYLMIGLSYDYMR
ncbi:hypothetical protein [Cellulosimicrobium cellulans]|uniref:hypothetical protein n=1 Tax=Cellulosimicrobium cellulans TaxID=1710 RepID=UPI00130D7E5C|nr:hypothetical protein [Cellulosimicrobium cellulans]